MSDTKVIQPAPAVKRRTVLERFTLPKWMPPGACIYQFVGPITGDSYVGSTKYLRGRLSGHCGDMLPQKLTQFWEKETGMVPVTVLEECNFRKLPEREAYWIEKLSPTLNGTWRTARREYDDVVLSVRVSCDVLRILDRYRFGLELNRNKNRAYLVADALQMYFDKYPLDSLPQCSPERTQRLIQEESDSYKSRMADSIARNAEPNPT